MAFARQVISASGANPENITITFPFLLEAHVVVTRDGVTLVQNTDYLIVSSTTVRFNSATSTNTAGDTIVIQRITSQDERLVDYATASTLTEIDMDTDSLQAFYMAQEALDIADLSIGLDDDDQFTAEGKRIKDVATPTDAADAATKAYVDGISVAAGNVPTPDDPGDDDGILVADSGAFAWVPQVDAPYIAKTSETLQAITRADTTNAIGITLNTGANVAARWQINSGASQNVRFIKRDSSTPSEEATALVLENSAVIFELDNQTERFEINETDAQGELLVRQADKWEGFAVGTAGSALITQGAAANPEWFPVGQWIAHADNPKAAASGTEIDFTALPADVEEILVVLSAVTADSTSGFEMLVGGADTGYSATVTYAGLHSETASASPAAWSSSVNLVNTSVAANTYTGTIHIHRIAARTYALTSNIGRSVTQYHLSTGIITLTTEVLDRLKVNAATDDFDGAGVIYVLYRRNPAG